MGGVSFADVYPIYTNTIANNPGDSVIISRGTSTSTHDPNPPSSAVARRVFGAEPTTGADDAGKQQVDRHVAPQAPSFPGPSFLAPATARRHRQFGHKHIVVSSSGRSHSLGVLANEVLVTHGRSHTHTRVLTVLPGIIQYHCDESNGTQSRTVKFE